MIKKTALASLMLLALMISACSPAAQPGPTPETLPLNVGYTALTANQSELWYAYENGYFDRNNLDVNLTYINSGTKGITALLSGDIDVVIAAGSATLNARAAGQDVVMIAGFFNVYPASLVVTGAIQTADDLKGKAVAISQPGSSTDAGARIALKYLDLVPDQDVTLLAVGEEGDRLKAMDAGQVAGAILTTPSTILAYDRGYHDLVNLSEIGVPYQHTGVVTTQSYLAAHPDECERFLKALIQSIHDMKKDPEGTKAVLLQYMLLDPVKDAAALEDAYQTLIVKTLSSDPYPSLAGIQTLIDLGAPSNPAVLDVKPEEMIDTSILDKLHSERFFETLK